MAGAWHRRIECAEDPDGRIQPFERLFLNNRGDAFTNATRARVSCTISTRLQCRVTASTASLSSGASVLRSSTAASMPSAASVSETRMQ